MRALLFHAKEYRMKVTGLATRPKDVRHELVSVPEQDCMNCIVALICVEAGDGGDMIPERLAAEIVKMTQETGHKSIVLAPFAHLSSNLASSEQALMMLDTIQSKLAGQQVIRSHFGSDKELLLDIFGHPGNARFREFN